MAKRKVLLVVEGAKQEPLLMRRIFEVYGLDAEYEIYSYGTNIHELYQRLFGCDDDPSDLMLLGVLKEREADDQKRSLLDENYSDVLLIFDYDPQDERFVPGNLQRMQEHFSDSTNEGKLYINYPMVEACRHFAAFPDPPFLTRSIEADEVKRYKALVGEETAYQNFQRSFSKREFDSAITHSLVKGFSLIGEKCNPPECWKRSADFDHAQLLACQSSTYAMEKKLPVLGTCLFFVSDYSPFLIDLHEGDDGLFRQ